jgi:hypothetical protein
MAPLPLLLLLLLFEGFFKEVKNACFAAPLDSFSFFSSSSRFAPIFKFPKTSLPSQNQINHFRSVSVVLHTSLSLVSHCLSLSLSVVVVEDALPPRDGDFWPAGPSAASASAAAAAASVQKVHHPDLVDGAAQGPALRRGQHRVLDRPGLLRLDQRDAREARPRLRGQHRRKQRGAALGGGRGGLGLLLRLLLVLRGAAAGELRHALLSDGLEVEVVLFGGMVLSFFF